MRVPFLHRENCFDGITIVSDSFFKKTFSKKCKIGKLKNGVKTKLIGEVLFWLVVLAILRNEVQKFRISSKYKVT